MPTRAPLLSSESILTFMAEYGRAYLSSGGPTSRAEEALSSLGRRLGYPTEVFATPTGIFVSCVDQHGGVHTTLCRIKDAGINLGRLCWLESIFDDVHSGKITLNQANKILHGKAVQKPPYAKWQLVAAAFLSGFALSYPGWGNFFAAVVSGLITVLVWRLLRGTKSRIPSAIFRDFLGSTTTLGAAALFRWVHPAPFEAYSIGGLVLIVPGLALTTAISELADQNLVSGASKLMHAVLTLLAMGLAYLLFQDLATFLNIVPTVAIPAKPLPLAISAVGMIVSVACFGVLFGVPLRSLPWASLTGVLGWFIIKMSASSHYVAAASYLAALSVGLVSLFIAQRFKLPSQVFSVPGILALLPGMLALTSFRSFAMGQWDAAIELAFLVTITSSSIVFGLFTARIPFLIKTKDSA